MSNPLFTAKDIYRLLWPLLVEQLLTVLVGLVDILMVASVGEAAVSGVSLIDSINQLVLQFLSAMGASGTVVCAQFLGRRDQERVSRSSGQLFLIMISSAVFLTGVCLLSGIHVLRLIYGQVEEDVMNNAYVYFMITALSFPLLALYYSCGGIFRAFGNSRTPMLVSLFMNGINIGGDGICIFLLHMGVAGVAIPTVIARGWAALLILFLLQRPSNSLRLRRISDLRPDPALIRRILGIGIPGGVESGMFQFGKLMLQSLVSTLGTASIAGFAVACNLVTFLYLPGNAVGITITTVVGQCVGAGQPDQAKANTRKLILINYAFLAVLASVLGLGRIFWVSFYNLGGEASAIAAALLLAHCIAMIIWPVAFALPYAFRAANDARFTMFIAIFSMWVFRVGLAYLFVAVLGCGILFVWYAMFADWIFRMIVFLLRYRGFSERAGKLF